MVWLYLFLHSSVQFSPNHFLNRLSLPPCLPGHLHPSPGSWLLSSAWVLQVGVTGSTEGGFIAFPPGGWCQKEENAPSKIVSEMWQKDSAQRSWQLSLQLSWEPPTPVSPHVTPVPSVLSAPAPRVSGCKRDFVLWLCEGVPVSLADSCLFWQTESLLIFTAKCYVGASSWL